MVAKRQDISDLPFWPRLLSTEQAMAYLGTSKNKFSATYKPLLSAITDGRTVRYDIKDLDIVVDKIKGKSLVTSNENKKSLDDDFKRSVLDKF